jgi:hypothetical protein
MSAWWQMIKVIAWFPTPISLSILFLFFVVIAVGPSRRPPQ